MRIWKATLAIIDQQFVRVPSGAEFLTAQTQRDQISLWFLCDESAENEHRTIAIYGTGNPMPDKPGKYIATTQDDRGLVWHVFEAEGGHGETGE